MTGLRGKSGLPGCTIIYAPKGQAGLPNGYHNPLRVPQNHAALAKATEVSP